MFKDVNVSLSTISFTVTIYMIVQGLAPSFWGPMSDTQGRRVAYIGTFLIYLAANVGLAVSNNFVLLMVFRALQAAGSAATIAIGSGVIADIATPRQRGAFTGINSGSKFI
jgi:MFS family permease